MNELLDEFDEWELRDEREHSESESSYKGKEPKDNDEISDNEEDATIASLKCPDSPSKASEPGDLTCAICLHDIQLENLAMVKGCDHLYCAHCILLWALHKDHPWCPQCKQEFSYLLTYRGIDGELHDFPVEESVVLLKRARWFEDSLKSSDIPASLLDDSRLADDLAWHDTAEDYDFAEDEAIEAFYFSSAAGRARVLIGNRRFGDGGFISGGRRQARPVNNNASSRQNSGKRSKGKGGGKPARAGEMAVVAQGTHSSSLSPRNVAMPPLPSSSSSNARGLASSSSASNVQILNAERSHSSSPSASVWLPPPLAVPISTPNANGGRKARLGSSPLLAGSPSVSGELMAGGMVYGSSPSGSGRRARRNARRAAAAAATAFGDSDDCDAHSSGGCGNDSARDEVHAAVIADTG